MKTRPARKLVKAIRSGDIGIVEVLLSDHPGLASERVGKNPRTMLHYATDWPGNFPNVARTIELLCAAGADVNAGSPHPTNPLVSETPLHWAVSSGDIAATEALIVAGADVDPPGGIFDGCFPFEEAIIFENYDAARVLLAHGATPYLSGAAALGQQHEVESYFDVDGNLDLDRTWLSNWKLPRDPQPVLDRAFQFACRAGHLEIAKYLLERGADPRAITPTDTTALDWAADNGHADVVSWLEALVGPSS
ncbi:MAG: ankyrin repeat domain-containing protein [Acidimicrobiales bacterium]|nr:ankyrin repeat domain-containing protein [Acidimicrobiales bacterium]RZV46953.1 MAG: ankyrin repeat domain-containing protein [Acidimicrobiales bacterium]